MRSTFTACALLVFSALGAPAWASTYIALGDSITFGEADLRYIPSDGIRGYVDDFAGVLASRNGGLAPNVINLAIDGETSSSFFSGVGRTPPVVGRGDLALALQNTNYSGLTPRAISSTSCASLDPASQVITAATAKSDRSAASRFPSTHQYLTAVPRASWPKTSIPRSVAA